MIEPLLGIDNVHAAWALGVRGMRHPAMRVDELAELITGRSNPNWREAFDCKTILDIGCGSIEEYGSMSRPILYEPFFARLVSANGATTYGIDINYGFAADRDVYTHIQVDIIPHVLGAGLHHMPQLHSTYFDAIHVNKLVGRIPPRELFSALKRRGISVDDFASKLIAQAGKMLKERGLLLVEEAAYKRIHGRLAAIRPPLTL